MIPPVEVRQNRACADPQCTCVYYRYNQENGHWCVLDVTKYHKEEIGVRWRWGNPIKPCSRHLTVEETIILEDQNEKEFRAMMELYNGFNKSNEKKDENSPSAHNHRSPKELIVNWARGSISFR